MKTKYIIAIALLCLLLAGSTGASARTITVGHTADADYWTIQEAVDAAAIYGDTIQVMVGTYNENAVISKSLILRGDDKTRTIIDGGGNEVVVNVTADDVTIRGFTIQDGDAGIRISSKNSAVIDNIIKVKWSYHDKGIYLSSATGTTISDNTISGNFQAYHYGIYLTAASTKNSFYHNNIMCDYNGYDSSGINGWDNGLTSGGNYWDDYSGVDSDGDGIGDTPHYVSGGANAQDNYPFMEKDGWKKYTTPTPTPAPTTTPTSTPTPTPSPTPAPEPTPTASPTTTPQQTPTEQVTVIPTATPIPTPVDTSPPAIRIDKPVTIEYNNNGLLEEGEKVTIIYGANDPSGVASIKILLDGAMLESQNQAGTYTVTTNALTMGRHTIRVEATDSKSNRGSEELQITVERTGPSVYFGTTRTTINKGEDAIFTLSAVNPIGNPSMTVQLILKPPSGVSVTSSSFAKGASGIYTCTQTIESGDNVRSIEVRLTGNQAGTHELESEVYYQFDGSPKSPTRYETLTLVVDDHDSTPPTPTPMPTQSPGFAAVVAVIGLLAAYLRGRRR
jgi:PGF-CTERM protein